MPSEKLAEPSVWAWQGAKVLANNLAEWFTAGMQRRVIATALDAAKAQGIEECHACRDHADRDARALAAERLGLAWAGGNLPPMWDDIVDAARNEGRREREGEIVGWLRDDAQARDNEAPVESVPCWPAIALRQAANEIERGVGCKERT